MAETKSYTNDDNERRKELIEEYKEALTDCRHHDNLIWTVFSIYFALNGGIMAFVPNTHSLAIIRAAGAIIIVMSFAVFLHVKKSQFYYAKKAERAKEIEKMLGFSLYTNPVKVAPEQKHRNLATSPFAKATNYVFLVIIAIGVLWFIIIYDPVQVEKIATLKS